MASRQFLRLISVAVRWPRPRPRLQSLRGSVRAFAEKRARASIEQGITSARLFELMDVDGDGVLHAHDLRHTLDVLHRSNRGAYHVMAPVLMEAMCESRLDKELLVKKLTLLQDTWDRTMGSQVLRQAVASSSEALEDEWKRIRDRSKALQSTSQDSLLEYKVPANEVFPKQELKGTTQARLQLRRANLRSFEPCPIGYTFAAYLGGGSFANVFLVRNTVTNNLQAMKRIDRDHMKKSYKLSDEQVSLRIEHEFQHMSHTDHPHVVRLVDFLQDSRYAYFIMEAANGGDLKRAIDYFYGKVSKGVKSSIGSLGLPLYDEGAFQPKGRLSEAYAADILDQTAYALRCLHLDLRIHKDIKSENIMLLKLDANRPHAVLIDLGVAEVLVDEEQGWQKPMPAGTPYTMAPEIIETFLGTRPHGFDQLSDIYSLGVVAFELLTGRTPYEPPGFEKNQVDYRALLELIKAVDVREQILDGGRSEQAADLVAQMMEPDPSQRLSAKQVIEHPWMQQQRERLDSKQIRTDGRFAARLQDANARSAEVERQLGKRMMRARRKNKAEQLVASSQRPQQQRNAAYYLVRLHMPAALLPRAARHFRRLDIDLTGAVSYNSLALELVEQVGLELTTATCVAMALDTNNSGRIEFSEFMAALVSLDSEQVKSTAPWVFHALEANWDRSMNATEVPAILAEAAGGRLQMAHVEEWLKAAAANLRDFDNRIAVEVLGQTPAQD